MLATETPLGDKRTASTRGKRLRLARERLYKSGRIAAQELGVAVSAYGAHERAEDPGGRDFGPDEAKFYARRFGVTPEWLLTGRWQRPDGKPMTIDEPDKATVPLKVPIVGYVGSGSQSGTASQDDAVGQAPISAELWF